MNKTKKTINPIPQPANLYDDGNIPAIDLPGRKNSTEQVKPLPESSRPRKDGPGGA